MKGRWPPSYRGPNINVILAEVGRSKYFVFWVMIHKTTQSMSPYLYNALQIQPQITSNIYAAELQKKIQIFFFKVTLGFVTFS